MDGLVGWQPRTDFFGAGPAELFCHRPLTQPDVAKPEGCKGILSKFDRIIPSLLQQRGFRRIHLTNPLEGFAQIGDRKRLITLLSRFAIGCSAATEHIENQDGKVTGEGTAAFAYQGR